MVSSAVRTLRVVSRCSTLAAGWALKTEIIVTETTSYLDAETARLYRFGKATSHGVGKGLHSSSHASFIARGIQSR